MQSLALTPNFIKSIGFPFRIETTRSGMLAAEVIAELCNKKLNFGDWDGDDSGKPWCQFKVTLENLRREMLMRLLALWTTKERLR